MFRPWVHHTACTLLASRRTASDIILGESLIYTQRKWPTCWKHLFQYNSFLIQIYWRDLFQCIVIPYSYKSMYTQVWSVNSKHRKCGSLHPEAAPSSVSASSAEIPPIAAISEQRSNSVTRHANSVTTRPSASAPFLTQTWCAALAATCTEDDVFDGSRRSLVMLHLCCTGELCNAQAPAKSYQSLDYANLTISGKCHSAICLSLISRHLSLAFHEPQSRVLLC